MRPLLFFTMLSSLAAQAPDAAPPQATFDFEATFAAARAPLDEARWTLVPWRHSLTEALAEARQTNKPVYLFVNDGDVESGRC